MSTTHLHKIEHAGMSTMAMPMPSPGAEVNLLPAIGCGLVVDIGE